MTLETLDFLVEGFETTNFTQANITAYIEPAERDVVLENELAFNYTFYDYTSQEIYAKLYFESPDAISSSIEFDSLVVQFEDFNDYGD